MTPIILHYKNAPSTLIPDACTPTGRGWEQPSDAASAHSPRVFFGEAAGAPHPYGLPSQQTPASSRNKGARGPRARRPLLPRQSQRRGSGKAPQVSIARAAGIRTRLSQLKGESCLWGGGRRASHPSPGRPRLAAGSDKSPPKLHPSASTAERLGAGSQRAALGNTPLPKPGGAPGPRTQRREGPGPASPSQAQGASAFPACGSPGKFRSQGPRLRAGSGGGAPRSGRGAHPRCSAVLPPGVQAAGAWVCPRPAREGTRQVRGPHLPRALRVPPPDNREGLGLRRLRDPPQPRRPVTPVPNSAPGPRHPGR